MEERDQQRLPHGDEYDLEPDEEEYDQMVLLERLESLREDMEELGISSLAQLIERIESLHRQLDER